MRITVLAENTSIGDDFGYEHGLSLYIETEKQKILFDMGQTELFWENAQKLGIDLSETDIAVLSHGHYDHGGGLKKFLEINRKAPVYISRYAFEPHFNGKEKYIGLDISLRDNARFVFTEDSYEIGRGLMLYSCNDRPKIVDMGSFGLNSFVNDKLVCDDFRHEQYLLIEEEGRRILFSGCSHKGVINIAEWFAPHVLVGGFHFSKLSPGDVLEGYARKLDSYDTDYYTCHCTGTEQLSFMKNFMGRLRGISCGESIVI